MQLIDAALLAQVTAEALQSPRRRKNRNFHPSDDFPAHRLLNAIEPGSYITPHRHIERDRDETIIVLAGRLGVALFDDQGRMTRTAIVGPGETTFGVDIEHGTWHMVFALVSGTVIFEAKAGPFRPLRADERAPWAPQEGDPTAADYLRHVMALFQVEFLG